MDGINKGKQKLPCEICKGKCCTFPAMSKREFKTIRKYYKIPDGTVFLKTEYFVGQITPVSERDLKTCTFLDKNGRCSVYQHRPLTCKSYGKILSAQIFFRERRYASDTARHGHSCGN